MMIFILAMKGNICIPYSFYANTDIDIIEDVFLGPENWHDPLDILFLCDSLCYDDLSLVRKTTNVSMGRLCLQQDIHYYCHEMYE